MEPKLALRRKAPEWPASVARRLQLPTQRMTTVLVIGGDNHDRRFLSDLLCARGIAVVFATDGIEALEIAEQSPPALAFSELLMPLSGGELLIRAWKNHPSLGKVPFVVLANAGVNPEDERIALELGADGFVSRPIAAQELAPRIDEILAAARNGRIRHPVDADAGHLLRLQHALVGRLQETLRESHSLGDALDRKTLEHEMLEAELRETKKRLRLEAQSQPSRESSAVATMAAALAHDLNNTLGVILGNADLAAMDCDASEAIRTSLSEITKAGRRGNEIVQEILSFGRHHTSASGRAAHDHARPGAEAATDPGAAVTRPRDESGRGRGQHILYLDDEEPLVHLAVRMLTRRGYRVSGFVLPQEALDRLKDDPSAFDIVVTDFNMPHLTGLQVAREVAMLRPDLPVMVTSGLITDDLRRKAAEAGARYLVEKPDTIDGICSAVHEALSAG